MSAPERITVDHKRKGETAFSARGAMDTSKAFCADYVRQDIADRSQITHNHEFAIIKDMWGTLPETLSDRPWAKTADSLRKHALIECGYCNNDVIVFETVRQAESQAARVRSIAERDHGYAIVAVNGSCVHTITPHSQSMTAMGGKIFNKSKKEIIEWIEGVLEAGEILKIAGTG